jgi:hypothetical protein
LGHKELIDWTGVIVTSLHRRTSFNQLEGATKPFAPPQRLAEMLFTLLANTLA